MFVPFAKLPLAALSVAALLSAIPTASAHVVLEREEAQAGSYYRGVLRVPHGCGREATTGLTVTIPEGVIAVKPMPKPGWTVAVTSGPLARSYEVHGRTVTTGVKTITWSGGSLPNEHYDEFIFSGLLAETLSEVGTVHFPVIQTCASGENRWVEIAAPGQSAHALKAPAPALRIASRMAARETPVFGRGPLRIEAPWARATPGGARVGAGYGAITNFGTEPDRLLAVSFPFAERVEIHETAMNGAVMAMREVKGGLVIAPGDTVTLRPGGHHLMLMGLMQPLRAGDVVKATMTFERAGAVEVELRVRAIGSGAEVEHRH